MMHAHMMDEDGDKDVIIPSDQGVQLQQVPNVDVQKISKPDVQDVVQSIPVVESNPNENQMFSGGNQDVNNFFNNMNQ